MSRFASALALVLIPSSALAYGEPIDGVPGRDERLLLVLTNQIRQDPHHWPGWDTTLATPEARDALFLHPGLAAAAHGHAADMASHDFFSHDSFDGTTFPARVSKKFSGPAGENIYMATFGDEDDALTAWMNSTEGHRENLLEHNWNFFGPGFAQIDDRRYDVQDFGTGRLSDAPLIPAASWRIKGGQVELLGTWLDSEGKPPASFQAAIGDRCVDLTAKIGPPGNQTLQAMTEQPAGCEPLAFRAVASDGTARTYPDSGSFGLGSAASCADFDPVKRPTACGVGPSMPAEAVDRGCRCAGVAPGAGVWLGLFALLFVARRSRG